MPVVAVAAKVSGRDRGRGRQNLRSSGKTQGLRVEDLGVAQNQGYLFGGPYNKDSRILGSILGYPNFGKLPFRA